MEEDLVPATGKERVYDISKAMIPQTKEARGFCSGRLNNLTVEEGTILSSRNLRA